MTKKHASNIEIGDRIMVGEHVGCGTVDTVLGYELPPIRKSDTSDRERWDIRIKLDTPTRYSTHVTLVGYSRDDALTLEPTR